MVTVYPAGAVNDTVAVGDVNGAALFMVCSMAIIAMFSADFRHCMFPTTSMLVLFMRIADMPRMVMTTSMTSAITSVIPCCALIALYIRVPSAIPD